MTHSSYSFQSESLDSFELLISIRATRILSVARFNSSYSIFSNRLFFLRAARLFRVLGWNRKSESQLGSNFELVEYTSMLKTLVLRLSVVREPRSSRRSILRFSINEFRRDVFPVGTENGNEGGGGSRGHAPLPFHPPLRSLGK